MNPNELLNNRYFMLNKKVLILIGVWPYQSRIYQICIRTFIIISIFTMCIAQIRLVNEVQKDVYNINILYENCIGFMYFQGCVIKYLAYIIYDDKLKIVYEEVTKHYNEIKEENEVRALHRIARVGRKLSVAYIVFGYVGGWFFISINAVIPLVLNIFLPKNESLPLELCYYAEYYVDQEEYFSLLYLHTLICVYCTIVIWTTVDSAYVNCVMHTIALFEVIKYRMSVIREKFIRPNNENRNSENVIELQRYIIDSIKLHNKAIKFAELIQQSYDNCFFYTFIGFICGLGIAMVEITHSIDNIINLTRVLILDFGVFVHLFYLTCPGQALIDASEHLRNAIYYSEWFELPEQEKFLLNFMMMRCLKPCRMTAGPLIELNMEHCGMIIKVALSYFTLASSFT